MNQQCEILNSKLSAPKVSGTVPRSRLEPYFSTILKNKITLVTAGAGFGKSTIIAQACDFNACDKSWYRLESDDADPVTFINYLIAGIRKSYPDFGKRTLSILNTQTDIVEINNNVLSVLLNEFEDEITKDFLIVLDDCHVLSESKEIKAVLQYIIDHIPHKIHLVMMSRNESFLSLSKFRTNLEINEIDQKDLEFTVSEIQDLFNKLSGSVISKMSLNHLYSRTEGWISGLILFYHLSKDKNNDEIEALLLQIKSNHKVFREYLGENVFEEQPEDVRYFLIQTSLFKQLDVEFCNRLLKIENSGNILSQLEKNYLFTTSIDNEEKIYCYHHLFQEFLRGRLEQEEGISVVKEIHYRSAKVYEEMYKEEDALYHYLEAKKYDDVFRLLQTVGHKFFTQGRHTTLDELLKKIPEQNLLKEPWALALKARLYTSGGQLVKAIQYGKRSHEIFIINNLPDEADTVLADCGTAYYMMGDFSRAEEIFIKILANNLIDDFTLFRILGNLIFTTSYFGNFEQSDQYFEEAELKLDQLEASMEVDKFLIAKIWLRLNYGFRWYFYGDITKATVYAESVYHDITELESPTLMAYYSHLVSLNQLFLGKIEEARQTVSKGRAEIYGKGFQGNQEAWLSIQSAMIFMIEGNYEDSIKEIENGLAIFRLGGNKWGEGYILVLLTILNEKLGQVEKAKQIVMEGLQLVSSIKLPWVEGKLYSFAALNMINQGNYSQGDFFLNKSEELLSYSQIEKCCLNIIRAKYYIGLKEEEQTIESLITALDIGEKYLYGGWLLLGMDNLIYYYVKIYSMGKYKNYIVDMFSTVREKFTEELYQLKKNSNKQIKMAASEIITQLPVATVPPLKIKCFGQFKVFSGKREVKSSDWKSNKAREIFKYLVYSRNKAAVPRDVLLELIWPEEDYEKTIKRLHVALPALRKTLEPDVRRGESSYLIRDNDLYSLDFGEEGEVDVDIFLKEIKSAEKEIDQDKKLVHLLKAESYYSGDFFAEDIYTEWCFEERENLKRRYLKILDNLVSIFKSYSDLSNCIKYSEKFLEIDDYSEGVYHQLMQFYYDSGQINMVIKTYEKCCEKVVDDLGCPLSEEISEFYDKVVTR